MLQGTAAAKRCFQTRPDDGSSHTGEPEPQRCAGKAEASQPPGAATAPKQCRDRGWNRKRTGNSHDMVSRRRPKMAVQRAIVSHRPGSEATLLRSATGHHAKAEMNHRIFAMVSMPLVAMCSDGGGRPSAATKSDWHPSLALARSGVDWASLCSTSRECGLPGRP